MPRRSLWLMLIMQALIFIHACFVAYHVDGDDRVSLVFMALCAIACGWGLAEALWTGSREMRKRSAAAAQCMRDAQPYHELN